LATGIAPGDIASAFDHAGIHAPAVMVAGQQAGVAGAFDAWGGIHQGEAVEEAERERAVGSRKPAQRSLVDRIIWRELSTQKRAIVAGSSNERAIMMASRRCAGISAHNIVRLLRRSNGYFAMQQTGAAAARAATKY
jgi:hypothetical protein